MLRTFNHKQVPKLEVHLLKDDYIADGQWCAVLFYNNEEIAISEWFHDPVVLGKFIQILEIFFVEVSNN